MGERSIGAVRVLGDLSQVLEPGSRRETAVLPVHALALEALSVERRDHALPV